MRKDVRNLIIFIMISVVVAISSYFLFSNGIADKILGSINKLKASVNGNEGNIEDYPVITYLLNTSGEKEVNTDVVVTINASGKDEITDFEYSFDKKTWYKDFQDIKTGKQASARKIFTDTMNKAVYFKVTNKYGYRSYYSKTIVNIDKEKPVIERGLSLIIATDNSLIDKVQYSNDLINWEDYDFEDIKEISLGKIDYKYVRAVDKSGNISEVLKTN